MKKVTTPFICLLFFTWAMLSCGISYAQSSKVRLQLKWFSSFQFAGYYMALEKGFYKEQGLEVEIIERNPQKNNIEQVINGEAEYGIADSAILLYRAKNRPVKVLASIFQHSPLVLIAKKSSGIISPYEMKDKIISFQRGIDDAPILTMLKKANISESDYQYQPLDFTNQAFIDDKVDVMSAYLSDQPFFMKEKDIEINVINPLNYGIDFYGDNLITNEHEINNYPKRVDAFKQASIKGWHYALNHLEETIQLLKAKYNTKNSLEHLRYEAKITKELMLVDLIDIGYTSVDRFYKIAETYARLGKADKSDLKKALEALIYEPSKEKTAITYYLYISAFIIALALLIILFYFQINRKMRKTIEQKTTLISATLDNIQYSVITVDHHGLITSFNKGAEVMLGYSAKEMVGKETPAVFHNKNEVVQRAKLFSEELGIPVEPGFQVFTIKTELGLKNEHEWIYKTQNGPEIIVMLSVTALKTKSGAIFGYVGIAKDITHAYQAETKIKRYVDLIDNHIITSSSDLAGTITSVSKAFCDSTGYTKEELINQNHRMLRDLNTDPAIYKSLWYTIRSNQSWHGELRNRKKDGSFYWIKLKVSPVYDENGIKIGYSAIGQDITDQKQIEKISITDALTELYNRRHFNEFSSRFINCAKRKNELIGFIILDIDNFKPYNDTYGHLQGDKALQLVSQDIQNSLNRASDHPFRLGGEEFGILFLPHSKENAKRLAEKIRSNIKNLKIEHKANTTSNHLTVSIGVVCMEAKDVSDITALYKEADKFLYQAKESGRNKVIMG